ncbi:MAG TPA: RNA polymerase sigma factor [Candidatus Sulfotelmatobacter sp.]|jgi:RNA polymerase sigma factor (sigma-70 family)|nr:RNA polymerase sigma factor [Candidatus Sulfotelmatobacter sp.]
MRPYEISRQSPGGETIEELFTALESPLLAYALRYTGTRELAEDIVQEAFMKLHAQFGQVEKPRPWLYRIVHNLALNHRRDNKKIVPLEPAPNSESDHASVPEPADQSLPPDEQMLRLEGIGLVRISLGALDDRSRELVKLKFNDELSYKQIAERTGLTAGNVGFILHHALKTIAAELAKTGVVP